MKKILNHLLIPAYCFGAGIMYAMSTIAFNSFINIGLIFPFTAIIFSIEQILKNSKKKQPIEDYDHWE